jgi:hypothetical protein
VAQLRSEQPVYLSADDTGTVQGALLLTRIDGSAAASQSSSANLVLEACAPAQFNGLWEYRTHWYALITQ